MEEKCNIPFSPPDVGEEEIREIAEAVRSGWITTGPVSYTHLDVYKRQLLEMPFEPWPESVFRELNGIKARGLHPIIAHLERYLQLQKKTDNIERLMDSDVLIQCNAEFFLQGFKSRKAFSLLKEDRIHLLGSDCHNLTSRPPNIGAALALVEKKTGRDAVERIMHRSKKVLS